MKRFVQCGAIGVLCFVLLSMSQPVFAKVVHVSPDGNDLNSGSSWATAKRTVKAGLLAATVGDQVWVRCGVYVERITLKNGVSLYGGFRGDETSLSQRPAFPRPSPDPYETVLDGNQEGSVVTSPDTATRAYRLDGFTIRNGKADDGGGLYLKASASYLLTVENCTITGNSASYGGGVYCSSSSPTLSNCTITGNRADYFGGGVCCYDNSSPTLSYCTIFGNAADSGGGVYCSHSSPTLRDCTIANNSANYGGGVCCSWSSSSTLSNCTIFGNTASNGGGVYCDRGSSPKLTNCTTSGNSANYGGGVYCTGSSPTLTNCAVSYNVCTVAGGGIWTDSSETKVRNSIVAVNAGEGIRAPALSEFRYNCAWHNLPVNFAGGIGNPIGSNGNISVDPLLVAGHLLPGSPCINAGDNSVVTVDTDIDGEARIAEGTVDIGADEFHAPIVQGYMVFNDFGGDLPPTVDWEIRLGSTEVRTLLLDLDGAFVIPRVPVGQFVLSVKPLSYLRRTVEVDTSGGSVLNLELSLTNGDIDGDNEVTLFDFGRLVAAFGSGRGDSNWDPRADLDGDEEVTLFDFGILVRNFGEIGDE